MPQQAWSNKRERQYEHIKEAREKRGASTKRAKEIAARTVNKERARSRRVPHELALVDAGHVLEPARRAPLAFGAGAQWPDEGAALQRGEAPEHQGPLEDEQAAAAAAVNRKK